MLLVFLAFGSLPGRAEARTVRSVPPSFIDPTVPHLFLLWDCHPLS